MSQFEEVTPEMVAAGLSALQDRQASDAAEIVRAVYRAMLDHSPLGLKLKGDWVCVPRTPTPKMLEAAWADALAENAVGVWKEMIEAASAD